MCRVCRANIASVSDSPRLMISGRFYPDELDPPHELLPLKDTFSQVFYVAPRDTGHLRLDCSKNGNIVSNVEINRVTTDETNACRHVQLQTIVFHHLEHKVLH